MARNDSVTVFAAALDEDSNSRDRGVADKEEFSITINRVVSALKDEEICEGKQKSYLIKLLEEVLQDNSAAEVACILCGSRSLAVTISNIRADQAKCLRDRWEPSVQRGVRVSASAEQFLRVVLQVSGHPAADMMTVLHATSSYQPWPQPIANGRSIWLSVFKTSPTAASKRVAEATSQCLAAFRDSVWKLPQHVMVLAANQHLSIDVDQLCPAVEEDMHASARWRAALVKRLRNDRALDQLLAGDGRSLAIGPFADPGLAWLLLVSHGEQLHYLAFRELGKMMTMDMGMCMGCDELTNMVISEQDCGV